MLDPIQKNIVDNYMQPIAAKKYDDDIKEWEKRLKDEANRNAEMLKDPQFAAGLGLPPNLPRHTINILKRTMAADTIGPQKPQVDKVYRRYGF